MRPHRTRQRASRAMPVFRATCYQIATPGIAQTAREAAIYKDTRFSDHAPLTIRYEMGL